MLYLRNTNQIQSLAQQVQRGPAGTPPPTPVITGSYFSGLGREQYYGAPAVLTSSVWFETAVQSGSTVVDSGSLQPTFIASLVTGSAQWKGYFLPSTTETYTFFGFSDDAFWLWLGNSATASAPTTASAVLGHGTTPLGGNRLTGSISLTSGSYYPMRVMYTAVGGPDFMTASFSSPTIIKTDNFTNYTFCNTSSLGF
jgi:hypothetical protein